ncbi:hypothetical protein KC717_02495 [Candidatus Dojkabacteria bacterium]|uniref:Uncharacterized protein n=1 Tax=Candidatus Dojkabacteria bacterium TaxID=2099670 RepID=A0A955L8B0_9BACT|nr:hypothetical protein [Candidatus Dojkabacteria bacterium]
MKYTQIPTQDIGRHDTRSNLGLYSSLIVFTAIAAFIGNYLIQNSALPEQSEASEVLTCEDILYDNFDSNELNKSIWRPSSFYLIENGKLGRLYDSQNWQGVYTSGLYSDDFMSEVEVSNLKYFSHGAAVLVAQDKGERNKFLVGLNDTGYVIASWIEGDQIAYETGSFRFGNALSVQMSRIGDSVRFSYKDSRGSVVISEVPAYDGDVNVGVATGAFAGENYYVTAQFDNFTLACPR